MENYGQMFDLMLYGLGFREGWKGLDYLREAIAIYRPGMMVTKEVYPEIEKKYHVPRGSVERACRRAIMEAWKNGNREARENLFGIQTFRPTVQQFIATVRRAWVGSDAE